MTLTKWVNERAASGQPRMGSVNMVTLIATSGITPEIGLVLPMDQAAEGFRAMWEGRSQGKTVFTR